MYRVSVTRKPAVRVYRIGNGGKKELATLTGWRAGLVKRELLRKLDMREVISTKNGVRVFEVDESLAIRVMLLLKAVAPVKKEEKLKKLIREMLRIDESEIMWWFSLYLKRRNKAINALRMAYS